MSISRALSFGNGRGKARSSSTVFVDVFTTNAPLRGFARFTLTLTPFGACFNTYALIDSARFLNACQDLHASMYTAFGGTVDISALSHGEPDPPAAAAAGDFFAATGFVAAVLATAGVLAFVARDDAGIAKRAVGFGTRLAV